METHGINQGRMSSETSLSECRPIYTKLTQNTMVLPQIASRIARDIHGMHVYAISYGVKVIGMLCCTNERKLLAKKVCIYTRVPPVIYRC